MNTNVNAIDLVTQVLNASGLSTKEDRIEQSFAIAWIADFVPQELTAIPPRVIRASLIMSAVRERLDGATIVRLSGRGIEPVSPQNIFLLFSSDVSDVKADLEANKGGDGGIITHRTGRFIGRTARLLHAYNRHDFHTRVSSMVAAIHPTLAPRDAMLVGTTMLTVMNNPKLDEASISSLISSVLEACTG